jgi:hypothetical protein
MANTRGDTPSVDVPDDPKHYVKCQKCGAWIDTRNLQQCLDHQGPHQHPKEGREQ